MGCHAERNDVIADRRKRWSLQNRASKKKTSRKKTRGFVILGNSHGKQKQGDRADKDIKEQGYEGSKEPRERGK